MKINNLQRRLLLLAVVFGGILLIGLFLLLSSLGFSIYDRLSQMSPWVLVPYLAAFLLLICVILWAVYAVNRITGKKVYEKPENSVDAIKTKLAVAQAQGFSVEKSQEIIKAVQKIEKIPEEPPKNIEVAFFGKISTGKSSLIQSLIPKTKIDISIIGGSTATIERYHYELKNGLSLTLLDMPGTHKAQNLAEFDNSVLTEARKVHIICYVLDQDITQSDIQSINLLHSWGKPLVVILNKINRYDQEDRELLKNHIEQVLPPKVPLIFAASAYYQSVRRVLKDGTLRMEQRQTKAEIRPLLKVFANLENIRNILGERQRAALLSLANDNLEKELIEFRQIRSAALVKAYSHKAMLGGMAAVTPGTDILIQGYLGYDLIKALGKLYGVSIKEADIKNLLSQATARTKPKITLVLALAGNICKAFPGVGTLIGGASHALAYGLIFDSLGRAVAASLAEAARQETKRENLQETMLSQFELQLSNNLENRANYLIKTAIKDKIFNNEK